MITCPVNIAAKSARPGGLALMVAICFFTVSAVLPGTDINFFGVGIGDGDRTFFTNFPCTTSFHLLPLMFSGKQSRGMGQSFCLSLDSIMF